MLPNPFASQSQRKKKGRKRPPPGSPPGTIVIDPDASQTSVRMIAFNKDEFLEKPIADPAEIEHEYDVPSVYWVQVEGMGDEAALQAIKTRFKLHPLALEDVVNLRQRPKIEEYGDHVYIVMRLMIRSGDCLATEQISIFLGRDFVLTFQERVSPALDIVRERVRKGIGIIRTKGPDYIVYAIIDTIIDTYFPLLEHYSDRIEELELAILNATARQPVNAIHNLKQELMVFRRVVWPTRDAMNHLLREPPEFLVAETRIHLRDCYDHTVQLIDLIETYRELTSDLMDIHLSNTSNRMNEVMKVLTVVSTIFIPLTFIAGVYGMNFDPHVSPYNMPELEWRYGYFLCLGLMVATAVALLVAFRWRGWIGPPKPPKTSAVPSPVGPIPEALVSQVKSAKKE